MCPIVINLLLPIGTITDASGRTLSGQTTEGTYAAEFVRKLCINKFINA